MSDKYQNIGLVMVYQTSKISSAYKHLEIFMRQHNYQLYLCDSVASLQQYADKIDCAVVVGGDGSILAVAEVAARAGIPLIGLHYGKLGFLSDINPENLQDLLVMLAGSVKKELRTLLEVTINDKVYLGLNEVAVNRLGALLAYDLYVDDNLMCQQRADGVLVHTPTGSTAYALSAGGPIIQPGINAFGIVPLNPHRLNTRPIVINNSQIILIKFIGANAMVSCDGRDLSQEANEIIIKKSTIMLTLLHPKDYDYFARLRAKLHWEQ